MSKFITITDKPGVIYTNADTGEVMTEADSPYEIHEDDILTVNASPEPGYHFPPNATTSWTIVGTA